jgi:hypothetical protein
VERQKFVRKNTAIFDAQRRNEKKRTRRIVFYVALFLSISLIFLGVCIAVFLNVEALTVNGTETYTSEQILEYVPIEIGQNIFFFDAEEIEETLKRELPYVVDVDIERDLPTGVNINVVEEKPFYAAELAGGTYLLSAELKVLEKQTDVSAEQTGITELSLNNVRRCIVGQKLEFIDERTEVALAELYGSFKSQYVEDKIKSVDVRSRFDIYINYDGRFEVYLGNTENIEIKISFLLKIIDELKPTDKGKINLSNYREAAVALS